MTESGPPPEPATPTAPEGGTSIVRTGEAGEQLRQRLERPARIGRTLMATLGAVILGAGLADWVTTRSPVGVAIAAFGGVLIALGLVQHFLYRRDLEHWPTSVIVWNEGIELVLSNGEVRGAMWSEADFATQLISRKAPPPAEREYLLLWLLDSRIPAVEISPEGFDRIAKIAADSGLRVSIARKGPKVGGTQFIQIRRDSPKAATGMAKTNKLEG